MIYTIYGKPKVGKTTFSLAGHIKGKTAVISADQGLTGIDTSGITVEEDTSSANLNKLLHSKTWMAKHQRIVVDTGTALYHDFLMEITGGSTPALHHRGTANNGMSSLLRNLRNSKKEVIILCQEKMVLPTEDWESDDDDEDVSASVTADLPQGPHNMLMQMSDVIGRLYVATVDDKVVRRLWLTPTPNIVAGARSKVYNGKPAYLRQPTVARLNTLLGWTR